MWFKTRRHVGRGGGTVAEAYRFRYLEQGHRQLHTLELKLAEVDSLQRQVASDLLPGPLVQDHLAGSGLGQDAGCVVQQRACGGGLDGAGGSTMSAPQPCEAGLA